MRRGREAAVAEYQASEADAIATRLAIAAQTADVYTAIRGLQVRLDIAKRQVRSQEDLLDKVRLLHSRGLAAEYQIQQTEGELSQVRASVPVLQAGLDAAMNALDVVLGTPPGTHRAELSAPGTIPRAPKLATTGSPSDLLRRRPDLIAAEHRLIAANARIGEAVSEYYPKFSLDALLGSTTTSGGNLFSRKNGTASLIEVLNADETLLRASDGRAQAHTESARAAIAAFRALGGGWNPEHLVSR